MAIFTVRTPYQPTKRENLTLKPGLKRATAEGSLPEIAQYSPYYLPLNVFTASKGSNLYILFSITAAGVVPCGGRKKSPRTSSIVQIIFYFGPLRSVQIFRVFKTLTFRNILLSNFLIIDPI